MILVLRLRVSLICLLFGKDAEHNATALGYYFVITSSILKSILCICLMCTYEPAAIKHNDKFSGTSMFVTSTPYSIFKTAMSTVDLLSLRSSSRQI